MGALVYRNIVIAYDGSDAAQAALDVAAGLAASSGGSLTLVQSVEGRGTVGPIGADPDPDQVAEARHALKAAAAKYPELEPSPWVASGPAGEAVVTVAKEIGADLIVTGSRGRGTVARALLGSVSSHLAHEGSCDVLVVHPRVD
jgi:Universal stress protein UspA and related nucleotide-binding proteins